MQRLRSATVTRRETIIELARTLNDALAVDQGDIGLRSRQHDYRGHRLSAMSLAFMHSHRKQYAIAGNSLGKLRWHFTTRYIHCTRKPLPARVSGSKVLAYVDGQWKAPKPTQSNWCPCGGTWQVKTDHGLATMIQVERWDKDVRHERVELALDWLERNMPRRLQLPDWDVLSEAA